MQANFGEIILWSQVLKSKVFSANYCVDCWINIYKRDPLTWQTRFAACHTQYHNSWYKVFVVKKNYRARLLTVSVKSLMQDYWIKGRIFFHYNIVFSNK